ncbi:hypothetical protein FS842_008067 [Serendipita sp. 407]|nr:hypothetical protein FS842_008067 [Serendipita sp. 407]
MPPKLTDYELQRQQNIEANQALLQQLKLDQSATSIGFVPVATSSKPPKALKAKAQPRKSTGTKKRKRQSKGGSDDDDDSDSSGEEVIRRASTRRTRRRMVDPNETKEEREKREEEEEKRALEEEKKMKADAERARLASMPRHRTLELWEVVAEESEPESQADSEGETGRSQRRDISDAITDGGEPDIEAPPLTDDEGISVKMEGDEDEEMSNASPRKAFSSPVSQNKDNGVLSNRGKGPNERKLRSFLEDVTRSVYPRYGIRDISGKVDPEAEDKESNDKKSGKQKLKEDMKRMRVAAIAKVTDDRIYSMAYHPDKTKDLMFFGDKHGQLGIWDPHALSPKDLEADDEEEDDVRSRSKSKRKKKDRGQGQTWQLQLHWPATSKSSVSGVKFDPVNGHSVYTSSYDCSIRQTHFNTGQSDEIYALDDILISSFDFSQTGHELWISDTKGGITFLDLRADKHDARRWQLSENQKIGSISLNPTDGWSLLASCNDRSLKLWDTRQLLSMPIPTRSVSSSYDASGPIVEPYETEYDAVSDWLKGGKGKSPTKGKGRAGANGSDATLRGTWMHGYSVSSAYWDPSGTRILSTSYDNKLRVWDLPRKYLLPEEPLKSFRPAVVLDHDCQTGRWLTVFKAQWSQNPEAYPYFSVGDMKHSLKLFAADGELLADLRDKEKITAVQAVTATHPAWTNRAGTGNASGKCIFWSGEKI